MGGGAAYDGAVAEGANEGRAAMRTPGPAPGSASSSGPGSAADPAGAYGRLGGLARSCHPLPSVAVTAISAALTGLAGNSSTNVLLVTAAVLAGQLSIGWSNDAIDAERDRSTQRPDKPVAAGVLPGSVVARAAAVALLFAIVLAASLGPRAGAAALLIVAAGWAYNGGLKATFWSWLPYAVAFGALPAVATLIRSGHPFPAGWAVLAGALLGVAAHLANVAPDLADDLATGVRGLPHRLGRRGTNVLGPILLAVAAGVVFLGAGQSHSRWPTAALVMSLAAAGSAAVIATREQAGRRYFVVTVIAAGLDVVLFARSGHRLS